MTKIKAKVSYWDIKQSRSINVGEEYEVDDERANQIINAGYASLVADNFLDVKEEEIKPVEEEVKEAPKKRAKKALAK